MTVDLPIRCACGQVQGLARGLSSAHGNHVVCYCDDCQVFQHFLGRAGDVLDSHGGTHIFQLLPADLAIEQGADQLACVRLTPRGGLRWYAGCCKTPIANTLTKGTIPFAGMFRACLVDAAGGPTAEQVLGPVKERVFKRFGKGDMSAIDAHNGGSTAMLFRLAGKLLVAKLRRRKRPTPFFDSKAGAPVAEPHRLAREDRRELDRLREMA